MYNEKESIDNILQKYIDSYHTISIIGTAKNAGKTTVLNAIIEEYKNEIIAITSIGLDGEQIDTVTNLPKPQIHVYKNTIIATAYDCIKSDVMIHENTNIMTPLGEIIIVEATKDQDILVAGPSTKHEMIEVVNKLKKYNPKKILIDGALFRRSLASTTVSDAVILSTGASYSDDMRKVVDDTVTIVNQFKVDEISDEVKNLLPQVSCVIQNNFVVQNIDDNWIHTNTELLQKVLSKKSKYLYLNGALTDKIIQRLIAIRDQIDALTIIVNDATHILCSSDYFRKLEKLNIPIKVKQKSQLLFVSYNPVSPYGYTFDNEKFKQLLEENISISCINVIEDRK